MANKPKQTLANWCDQIKDNHAFCIKENITQLEFVTKLSIDYFRDLHGCSTLIAAGYAKIHFEKVYNEMGLRVNIKH